MRGFVAESLARLRMPSQPKVVTMTHVALVVVDGVCSIGGEELWQRQDSLKRVPEAALIALGQLGY
jgi:hypothetical protein